MNEYELDPFSWFGEREISFTPPHFTPTRTPLTTESKAWIFANLRGRFSLVYYDEDSSNDIIALYQLAGCPAFELPQEAVLYELKWA